MSPEIYLAVDDNQEEKRENAVYDQVGVGQVNLIYKIESGLPNPIFVFHNCNVDLNLRSNNVASD